MPPPPPPPPFGAPRGMKPPVKVGAAMDRNALLSSIQKGATLKKTVTNDRSSPMINGKISNAKSTANGGIQGLPSGTGMVNGGVPQLGGLFAQGMPKLRPTGRGRNDCTDSGLNFRPPGSFLTSVPHFGKKPSAPPTPPTSAKPTYQSPQPNSNHGNNDQPSSNGYLPPSPKPSSKSNPAPPPPPSNRKPLMGDRGIGGGRAPFLDIPSPSSKPASPRPLADANANQSDERHPPLPIKPAFIVRPDPGSRGAPPRPPSSCKPSLPPKSPDLKPNDEHRRPSIDRSVSLREPQRPPFAQVKVGTSAESPAAPFRVNTNHREAPPVPSSRPLASKTVGRAAGAKLMMPALRPPSEKPPKPPSRPIVAAPPPPSQPPPPPPSNRGVTSSSPLLGGKADVPLPPIPHSAIPPPLPERNESTRATYNKQPDDFESKFSKLFKSRHQFPLPLTYNHVPKSYPSKSNALPFFLHQSYLDLHGIGCDGAAKNQRRAPLPPTATPTQTSTNAPPAPPLASNKPSTPHSQSTYLHSMGNNPPPPPPPHAPLHLQMDRKFYGTEASHC